MNWIEKWRKKKSNAQLKLTKQSFDWFIRSMRNVYRFYCPKSMLWCYIIIISFDTVHGRRHLLRLYDLHWFIIPFYSIIMKPDYGKNVFVTLTCVSFHCNRCDERLTDIVNFNSSERCLSVWWSVLMEYILL